MSDKDLSQCSLMELFHTEAETQLALMTSGLLALEKDPSARVHLEEMMRAAHSLTTYMPRRAQQTCLMSTTGR